jgi:hypothetical protein
MWVWHSATQRAKSTTNGNIVRATLVELHFFILELHFLILRRIDSSEEQGGEVTRMNSEVIPVANEWGAAGSGGERGFLAPSS